MPKLAQIVNNKVVAFYDDETDFLPDNSHFINVDDYPEVEIGWNYDGTFSEAL